MGIVKRHTFQRLSLDTVHVDLLSAYLAWHREFWPALSIFKTVSCARTLHAVRCNHDDRQEVQLLFHSARGTRHHQRQKKTRFQSLPALPGSVATTFHEFANNDLVGGLRGRSSGLAFSLQSAPAALFLRDFKSHHSDLTCIPLLASAKTRIVGKPEDLLLHC